MSLPEKASYTIEDIYSLPEGQRAELIDGDMYLMAPPSRIHQELVSELTQIIGVYIKSKNGSCKVYPAPFAVFLNVDDTTYVEPDISVICDKDKLNDKGCSGAPDWIIEIVSPSSQRMDYLTKLFKYRTAGVREYWIVNPLKETVQTYSFEGEEDSAQASFSDTIPSAIFKDLEICVEKLLR
ncbi:MAG: Uma2 family endonuclease [Eubacteriales bacterium]|nr:Uma2 family endonuclease [Eubacteriales bacterium]